MNEQVTQLAEQAGLVYNLDKSVVANSFHAYRFSHFAKNYGKQNEAEEKLFGAISPKEKILTTTLPGMYADEVRKDIYEAQQTGVRDVPFFLFNRKYAVSERKTARCFFTP